jgi:hypothetical protein
LEVALAHLLPREDSTAGTALVVHGDSGTGKTFFAREAVRRLHQAKPDSLYLYIDVANDEYQSSRTIASLLKMSFVAGPMTGTSMISVPEELSLQRYRHRAAQRGFGRGLLRAIAHAIGGAIGIGSAVSAALEDSEPASGAQVEDELARYLSWVAKRATAYIAIDNIQFLNLDVRLTIESVLERVGKNIRLIALDRTVDGVTEVSPPVRCFGEDLVEIELRTLSPAETHQLVASAVAADATTASRLADDIFTKTNGLAKDVEYCLRQYSLELGRGARAGAIDGLLTTIGRLPVIHREFLVIAALLDGGVKKDIAAGAVRRLAAIYDTGQLDAIVEDLVARDYLRLDSESGGRLRPGHERIVIAMRELADESLHEEVRRSLIDELAAALETSDASENETYLLHCLVGLQTARELTRSIHYISRLIQSQHRQDQFSYLVALADEIQDVLPLLPEHVLDDLLDAMQKSSAFEKGLQLVRLLDANSVPGADERQIYRLKYLTQAYRYDDALVLTEQLAEDDWGGVYQVNVLMALDRVEEARRIADGYLSPVLSECQAVMRRNTITLYDSKTALRNLDQAYAYFEQEQSDYRLATVDTNRSVVYLHSGRLGDAARVLDSALARMRYIGSRETYQPQINSAIRAALLGDYAVAQEALDGAAIQVPRALLLDQVKIDMNRAVIRCVSGALDAAACAESLMECMRRIRGFQMPYLHRALAANLANARGQSVGDGARDDGRVSLTLALPADGSVPHQGAWTLMTSVHWRY